MGVIAMREIVIRFVEIHEVVHGGRVELRDMREDGPVILIEDPYYNHNQKLLAALRAHDGPFEVVIRKQRKRRKRAGRKG